MGTPGLRVKGCAWLGASLVSLRLARRQQLPTSPHWLLQGTQCVLRHESHTRKNGLPMRTTIEIDDTLMAEAQRASGQATKKQTVEKALRLMVKLRAQQEVDRAFGKHRWRGSLARSRKGRRAG
jgi:Arc/MetJ family transcription regulator